MHFMFSSSVVDHQTKTYEKKYVFFRFRVSVFAAPTIAQSMRKRAAHRTRQCWRKNKSTRNKSSAWCPYKNINEHHLKWHCRCNVDVELADLKIVVVVVVFDAWRFFVGSFSLFFNKSISHQCSLAVDFVLPVYFRLDEVSVAVCSQTCGFQLNCLLLLLLCSLYDAYRGTPYL